MSVGDVNGDRVADLVIGVPYADATAPPATAQNEKTPTETDAGKVFVFYGGKTFGGAHALQDGADIVFADGGAHVAGSPDRRVEWAELAKAAYQAHKAPAGFHLPKIMAASPMKPLPAVMFWSKRPTEPMVK